MRLSGRYASELMTLLTDKFAVESEITVEELWPYIQNGNKTIATKSVRCTTRERIMPKCQAQHCIEKLTRVKKNEINLGHLPIRLTDKNYVQTAFTIIKILRQGQVCKYNWEL